MTGLVTPARSVAQTLRRNGFLGAHATSRALGLLPGECFVWFEWGSATVAAELLRGRGWRCKRSGRGLIVERFPGLTPHDISCYLLRHGKTGYSNHPRPCVPASEVPAQARL